MKIAITGGIGSGKSYVCRELQKRCSITVYDCDASAKRIMRTNEHVRQQLIELVGQGVYVGDILQKPVLAQFLLESEENKQAVNDIVHPAVAQDFEQSDEEWLESAILFDSNFVSRTHFDKVVCVTAPEEVRIARIMERDHISREKALDWINAQLPQEEVRKKSDFEIINDGKHDLTAQIEEMIKTLYKQTE